MGLPRVIKIVGRVSGLTPRPPSPTLVLWTVKRRQGVLRDRRADRYRDLPRCKWVLDRQEVLGALGRKRPTHYVWDPGLGS